MGFSEVDWYQISANLIQLGIALVLSVITFVTLRWVGGMKHAVSRKPDDEHSRREDES